MQSDLSPKTARIILLVIITFTLLLRFYKFPYRIGMGGDSTRDAFVSMHGAASLQLPLTGPFSSLGPFTFGPLYYWQLIFFTKIVNHYCAPWIYIAFLSSALVFIMYKIGSIINGRLLGILTAFLTTLSASQLSVAKGLSNPNMIGFFTGLSLFFTLYLVNQKKPNLWHGLLLGLSLGIGINCHYQMLGMVILPIMLLLSGKKMFRTIIVTYLGIIIMFVPLALFDLNNHWYTIRNLFYYYTQGRKAIYIPNRWLTYLSDFWPNFISYTLGIPKLLAIGMSGIYAILSLKNIRYEISNKKILVLWISFGINFLMLRYYWGERFMGYLQYFYPYLYLFAALSLFILFQKGKGFQYISGILFVILIFYMSKASFRELSLDSFLADVNDRTEKIIAQFPKNQTFSVYNCNRSDYDRTQAIAYTLYKQKKLSDTGIAIGLPAACPLPPNKKADGKTLKEKQAQLTKLYPLIPKTDAINLQEATEGARYAVGYQQISPQTVYESTVRWWFHEQP